MILSMTAGAQTRREIAAMRRKARRKRFLSRVALITTAGIFAVIAATVGYVSFFASQFDANTEFIAEPFVAEPLRPEPVVNKSLTFLVMGTDTRGKLGDNPNATGSRSDTILVIRVSGNRENVHVISIPRDSWVPIRGYGNGKINWALSYGGVKLAVDTVETLLDARIDHTILIDFDGVKKISTLVGGVPVDNPVTFDVRGATLERFDKGSIVVEGERALMFIRERHAFAEGDVSRIHNQQLFIAGFLKRFLSFDVLANPPKLTELFQSIGESLLVDKGFNSGLILGLGAELTGFSSSELAFVTLPFTGAGMQGIQFVVNLDKDEIKTLNNHLRSDTLDQYTPPALPSTDDWP